MLALRLFILLLLFTAEPFVAQCEDKIAYQQIRKQYQQMQQGDPAAIPFIRLLITLTKKERNPAQLTYAYLDALKFQPTGNLQLKYADSAIAIAHSSGRNALIAEAYMSRGMVNYAHYRNYQTALEDYVKAADYAKISDDPYLQYRLLYHFGVVKGYVGLHQDAIANLKMCAAFFRKELLKARPDHPVKNLRKNYYDSLHELVNIYQQTGKDEAADRLIEAALREIPEGGDFAVIRSCFLKSRAISQYRKGNYALSREELHRTLPELIKTKDFARVSLIYYYQGKNTLKLHRQNEAVSYFKKVDSIFQRHHFIFPELQHGYHYLIYHAGELVPRQDLRTYMDALRTAEHVHQEDRHHLYSTMQMAWKNDEKRSADHRFGMALAALVTVSLGFGVFTLETFTKNKEAVPHVFASEGGEEPFAETPEKNEAPAPQWTLSPALRERIRTNLRKFEEEKGFLKPGLKLAKVAREVGVNANYLSHYLNTEKGMRFDRYLSELRIFYIAAQLAENREMTEKGTAQLAALCGVRSPSNFIHLFLQIYGMPLHEYREQCREKFDMQKRETNGIS